MWIITNRGPISVVADRDGSGMLLVRARQNGLLETMIAESEIITHVDVWEDQTADYPYRSRMSHGDFVLLLDSESRRIEYPNFKASVEEPRLRMLYTRVWETLAELGLGARYFLSGEFPRDPKPKGAGKR